MKKFIQLDINISLCNFYEIILLLIFFFFFNVGHARMETINGLLPVYAAQKLSRTSSSLFGKVPHVKKVIPRDIISTYLYASDAGELMRGCYKSTRFDVNECYQQVPESTGFYN